MAYHTPSPSSPCTAFPTPSPFPAHFPFGGRMSWERAQGPGLQGETPEDMLETVTRATPHTPPEASGTTAHEVAQSSPEKPPASPALSKSAGKSSFLNVKALGKLPVPAYSRPPGQSRAHSHIEGSQKPYQRKTCLIQGFSNLFQHRILFF